MIYLNKWCDKMEMNQKIKELRLMRGMTLEQVGDLVGVGKSTVKKWESGQIANMRRDKIAKLAYALGTTPAYLMGWEEMSDGFTSKYPQPNVVQDVVTFPVIGEIAAGYDTVAVEDWSGDTVDIPVSFLHGRKKEEFFGFLFFNVLRICSIAPLCR